MHPRFSLSFPAKINLDEDGNDWLGRILQSDWLRMACTASVTSTAAAGIANERKTKQSQKEKKSNRFLQRPKFPCGCTDRVSRCTELYQITFYFLPKNQQEGQPWIFVLFSCFSNCGHSSANRTGHAFYPASPTHTRIKCFLFYK